MKKLLLFLTLLIGITFTVSAKYDLFPRISIGDVAKPEDGAIFSVQSTTGSSVPCPKMTEVQRDALVDLGPGFCIFNTTAASTQFYNGSSWLNAGSGAVLSEWSTGTVYGVGNFVYTTPDYKLWAANTAHTAGATFAGDIANWDELSSGMAAIGSSTDNGIARWDGTSGNAVQDSSVLIDDTDNVSGIVNLTVTGTTTINTGLTGPLKATSGVISASDIDLTSEVTGALPIANGGTNSSTALNNNFVMISSGGGIVEDSAVSTTELNYLDGITSALVELTGAQTITGIKTFSALPVFSAGIDVNDASTINASGAVDTLTIDNSGSGDSLRVDHSGSGIALDLNGESDFSDDITMSGTGQLKLPEGTTAQRSGTPADGMLRFNSDLDRYEGYKESSSAWDELGGGGQGGINYLADTKDSDFEISIGNWVAFDDGAVTVPVDGTGGSPTVISCTRNTTTPIRGSGDMVVTSTAASAQGEGCSADFDIDNGMKGQKLTGSLWVDTSAASYADDDLGIFVYDKTNTNLIRVNGEDIKGTKGKIYFQFQAASDSTSYRVILMARTTAVLGYSIYFDQISVGPTSLARGTIVTDWKDYTSTVSGLGTGSATGDGKWRRVGDSLDLLIESVKDGSNGTGTAPVTFSIPSGLSIDTAKLGSTGGNTLGFSNITFGATVLALAPVPFGATDIILIKTNANATFQGADFPATQRVFISLRVPIQGWSSNAQMSEDLGGREIVVKATGNDGETITADTEDIPFKTTAKDTTSAWSNAGNTGANTADAFTAPETGEYLVNGVVAWNASNSGAIAAYIDGVDSGFVGMGEDSGSLRQIIIKQISLTKGQVLTFRSNSGGILTAGDVIHYIDIIKLASPQTMLETETVAAVYNSNTAQPLTSGVTQLVYEDKVIDTHNAYNTSTGEYTVPTNGIYNITASFTTVLAHSEIRFDIRVNATAVKGIRYRGNIVQSGTDSSVSYPLNKGDVVTVVLDGSVSDTLNATPYLNVFSIARLK